MFPTNLGMELLEGHLGVTKELLSYQSIVRRQQIGCAEDGDKLLMVSPLSFFCLLLWDIFMSYLGPAL